ncbi:MAG: hypothetical protein EZS28_032619 [Streblomastix strix]|uniref:Uncharacterized protein n=1 Tax=Streblomastix strix TaxID=222440 RepID=A0A5J4UPZ8_9EUKA|nr:MAG: hypothetical protein EZS28_032619 [Streblomastix strix]
MKFFTRQHKGDSEDEDDNEFEPDPELIQTRPFVNFYSETAPFTMIKCQFHKAKLQSAGIFIQKRIQFTFYLNQFFDIDSTNDTANLVNFKNMNNPGQTYNVVVSQSDFTNIGMEGPFYDAIYFEQGLVSDRLITKSEEEIEIEQIDEPFDNIINLAGVYNTDACGIERCHFQSTAAINCGGIEFNISNDCDFVSFDNIFNNTSGGRASDLIMNVKPYKYYIYEIFGHVSNPTYSDRPTIIIGDDIIPQSYNFHRDRLDFIIIDADNQDRHKQELQYQPSIGEALGHMALNYTGWDLTFQLGPGIHGIDGNDAWGLTLTIGRTSDWKDRIEYFHPQKITLIGAMKSVFEEDGAEQDDEDGELKEKEEVTIQRSNGNSFAFKLIRTSTLILQNIKVQGSRTRVDGDNAFVTTYDESHIILDHMKFTNTDQEFELIKILSDSICVIYKYEQKSYYNWKRFRQ